MKTACYNDKAKEAVDEKNCIWENYYEDETKKGVHSYKEMFKK